MPIERPLEKTLHSVRVPRAPPHAFIAACMPECQIKISLAVSVSVRICPLSSRTRRRYRESETQERASRQRPPQVAEQYRPVRRADSAYLSRDPPAFLLRVPT